jgi:hypothetical protein
VAVIWYIFPRFDILCQKNLATLQQGGGPEKNNQKKWRAEEEERHKGLLTPPPPPKKKNVDKLCWNKMWTKMSTQKC